MVTSNIRVDSLENNVKCHAKPPRKFQSSLMAIITWRSNVCVVYDHTHSPDEPPTLSIDNIIRSANEIGE